MHLDNLLGNGEPQPGAAFRLGVGAVDLVELLEDARLVLLGNAGPGVDHTQAKWPLLAVAVMLTSPVSVNLMALPTKLSNTCVKRCSSPTPIGSRFTTLNLAP